MSPKYLFEFFTQYLDAEQIKICQPLARIRRLYEWKDDIEQHSYVQRGFINDEFRKIP